MRPLTFEQWRAHMLEETPASEKVDCPNCDGSGYTECCECGHEKECDDCEDGTVAWGDLDEGERMKVLTRARYEEVLMKDMIALASWKGTSAHALMVDMGFTLYSRIGSKRLCIVDPVVRQ